MTWFGVKWLEKGWYAENQTNEPTSFWPEHWTFDNKRKKKKKKKKKKES